MARIVVVGSANVDLVIQTPHLPEPGETVLGGKFLTAMGGKGANQAVAAARLGAGVTFVARVGDDAFGQQCLAAYQKERIDTQYVTVTPDIPTGIALIAELAREGRTILMVEHVMDAIRTLCDRCLVMSGGARIAEGGVTETLAHPEVVRAYLGDDDA